MNQITKLTEDDLWKRVIYKAFCVWDTEEEWVIKSFNNESKTAFVVYKCNWDWSNYQNYTGQGTNYCDLTFKF